MSEWNTVAIKEVLIAAPGEEGKWLFSGDVSEMMNYVFSSAWAEHVYDEYPAYFWADVLESLKECKEATEIEVDMVYDFGSTTEEEVRDYMETYKDEGPRFLIMPRTEAVTMACGWLRGFEIRDLESV